jgi:hypothetical protein
MRTPGFHDDVPETDYHADRDSLSVTGAKLLLKAPALFRHRQDNPEEHKDHFDVGHAAHELVLGIGAGIAIIPATSRAKADQEAHKAAKEAAYAEGKTPVTQEQYDAVQAMADKISEHETAMRLLSEGRPEVSAYALDEPTGVMRRCRFDWLGTGILTDLKTTRSAEPWSFAGDVAKYGYHQQAAWYLDLARDLGHPAEAFAFIVVEKEAPHLVEVYDLDAAALDRGRELNRRALERFRDCRESGIWPGYTARPFTTLSLPRWAHYDNEVSA